MNDLHKLDVYRCALDLYRQVGVMVARFPHEMRSSLRGIWQIESLRC